jgi:hypothetical protein
MFLKKEILIVCPLIRGRNNIMNNKFIYRRGNQTLKYKNKVNFRNIIQLCKQSQPYH